VEDRAVSIASAAAVSLVRGSRGAADEVRRLTAACIAWIQRTAPRTRDGITTVAARAHAASPRIQHRLKRVAGSLSSLRAVPRPWWQAAALIACVSVAILAGRSYVGGEAPRQGHAWEQLRALVGGKSSRVNVVVAHGLEDGTIELVGDDHVLLSDSLKAPKKDLLGMPFLSYRSGIDTGKLRLAPGRHELSIKVTAPGGLELVKNVSVDVAPNAEYDLQVSISTWPRKRISADWGLVAQ
jgi:hypothetical protein